MRLRGGDTVLVVKGRDRGKTGRIQRTFPDTGKVLVEGVNVAFRHTKATPGVRQAGIVQKELPVSAANVMLMCTHCNRPVRIRRTTLADGTKARVCSNCEEVIE
jgi:large subunit ribosomal protein L24